MRLDLYACKSTCGVWELLNSCDIFLLKKKIICNFVDKIYQQSYRFKKKNVHEKSDM